MYIPGRLEALAEHIRKSHNSPNEPYLPCINTVLPGRGGVEGPAEVMFMCDRDASYTYLGNYLYTSTVAKASTVRCKWLSLS